MGRNDTKNQQRIFTKNGFILIFAILVLLVFLAGCDTRPSNRYFVYVTKDPEPYGEIEIRGYNVEELIKGNATNNYKSDIVERVKSISLYKQFNAAYVEFTYSGNDKGNFLRCLANALEALNEGMPTDETVESLDVSKAEIKTRNMPQMPPEESLWDKWWEYLPVASVGITICFIFTLFAAWKKKSFPVIISFVLIVILGVVYCFLVIPPFKLFVIACIPIAISYLFGFLATKKDKTESMVLKQRIAALEKENYKLKNSEHPRRKSRHT